MSDKRYFDGFSSWESMRDEFCKGEYDYDAGVYKKAVLPDGFPRDEQVIFAAYGTEEAYSGDATVVYRDDSGQLMLATAGHCSCHGLEGAWTPVATVDDALARMTSFDRTYEDGSSRNCEYTQEACDAFRKLWAKVTP